MTGDMTLHFDEVKLRTRVIPYLQFLAMETANRLTTGGLRDEEKRPCLDIEKKEVA